MKFRFETDGKPLKEIAHHSICRQAAFRLDRPMNITTDDIFELVKGQWYLLDGDERYAVEGRWVTPQVEAIPEKPQHHRVHSVVVNLEDE